MKRIVLSLFVIGAAEVARAAANPFFPAGSENQISLAGGASTGPGGNMHAIIFGTWLKHTNQDYLEPFYYAKLEYSQPSVFFRLPARINLSVGSTLGETRDRNATAQAIAGISEDIALVNWRGFYFGLGFGGFIQGRTTERQASQFVFGAKSFFGYRWSDALSTEIGGIHYSNAQLQSPNHGYNFMHLTMLYNF